MPHAGASRMPGAGSGGFIPAASRAHNGNGGGYDASHHGGHGAHHHHHHHHHHSLASGFGGVSPGSPSGAGGSCASSVAGGSVCGPSGGGTSRRAHALRKCEICVFYLKGMCPSGDSCSYAHGFDELRAMSLTDKESQKLIPSARKFKTELCEKWLQTGMCCYGSRCCFLHPISIANEYLQLLREAANRARVQASHRPPPPRGQRVTQVAHSSHPADHAIMTAIAAASAGGIDLSPNAIRAAIDDSPQAEYAPVDILERRALISLMNLVSQNRKRMRFTDDATASCAAGGCGGGGMVPAPPVMGVSSSSPRPFAACPPTAFVWLRSLASTELSALLKHCARTDVSALRSAAGVALALAWMRDASVAAAAASDAAPKAGAACVAAYQQRLLDAATDEFCANPAVLAVHAGHHDTASNSLLSVASVAVVPPATLNAVWSRAVEMATQCAPPPLPRAAKSSSPATGYRVLPAKTDAHGVASCAPPSSADASAPVTLEDSPRVHRVSSASDVDDGSTIFSEAAGAHDAPGAHSPPMATSPFSDTPRCTTPPSRVWDATAPLSSPSRVKSTNASPSTTAPLSTSPASPPASTALPQRPRLPLFVCMAAGLPPILQPTAHASSEVADGVCVRVLGEFQDMLAVAAAATAAPNGAARTSAAAGAGSFPAPVPLSSMSVARVSAATLSLYGTQSFKVAASCAPSSGRGLRPLAEHMSLAHYVELTSAAQLVAHGDAVAVLHGMPLHTVQHALDARIAGDALPPLPPLPAKRGAASPSAAGLPSVTQESVLRSATAGGVVRRPAAPAYIPPPAFSAGTRQRSPCASPSYACDNVQQCSGKAAASASDASGLSPSYASGARTACASPSEWASTATIMSMPPLPRGNAPLPFAHPPSVHAHPQVHSSVHMPVPVSLTAFSR